MVSVFQTLMTVPSSSKATAGKLPVSESGISVSFIQVPEPVCASEEGMSATAPISAITLIERAAPTLKRDRCGCRHVIARRAPRGSFMS